MGLEQQPPRFLSLGMGRQSTALYVLSSIGEIAPYDAAFFADLGDNEGSDTRRFIETLMEWAGKNSRIPIVFAKNDRDLLDTLGTRSVEIPAYVHHADGTKGMIRRQCTSKYKIAPINRAIREFMGLDSKGKFPPFEQHFGINVHELSRMCKPKIASCINVYPLTGFRFTVDSHERFTKVDYPDHKLDALYNRVGLPSPPSSSCVFCPFQSAGRWRRRLADPHDRAIIVEAANRLDNTPEETFRSQLGLFPLQMTVDEWEAHLNAGSDQLDLFQGCDSGYCGV